MSEGAPLESSSGSDFQIPAFKRKQPKYDYKGENQFNFLPNEATLHVLSFLDARDLCHLSQVNASMLEFANDDILWRDLAIFDWGIDKPFASTWKESYALLDDLCEDGVWEGYSKWLEPAGFDTEQKTTARLQFVKRTHTLTTSPTRASPMTIHRVDSQTTTTAIVKSPSKHRDAPYRIIGSGVTVNVSTPSPFKIEGHRSEEDPSGCTFEWNKQFEKHTSVYCGRMDYASRTVTGTIDYDAGSVHWKGIFSYTKIKNRGSKLVMA